MICIWSFRSISTFLCDVMGLGFYEVLFPGPFAIYPLLGSLADAQMGGWKAEGRQKLLLSCTPASGQSLLRPAGFFGTSSATHVIPSQGTDSLCGEDVGQPCAPTF